MGSDWRAFRRRVLTPRASVATLAERGFHRKDKDSQQLLETVGRTFLDGYGTVLGAAPGSMPTNQLDDVSARFRGFAYEGAAMGTAVLDGLPLCGNGHTARFLSGSGGRHIYTAYVGVGWAMAKLPRFRGPRVERMDPLLRWLALDGYGFHQAYFHTRRYVYEQYRDRRLPWPADMGGAYRHRAVDQGIGRAVWFVGGTDVERVADMVGTFPASRRADLYSGVGLAAVYAGGACEQELHTLLNRSGPYRGQLAQGAAFGAEARVHGDVVLPETELATRVLCGTTPESAAGLTRELRPSGTTHGELPAYEAWRQRIADAFVPHGRC